MAFLSDATNQKANSTALEDLDYDDFLSEPEENEATTTSCEIPSPPPGITVTVHLDNNPKRILKTEHHQQLGDSFDYSNSDLHNVINFGRNAKTVIINKGEDHEEVEAYSPTSNYQLPENYEYNSRKQHSNIAVPPPQPTKQSMIDSTHQKLHSRCFLHPKGSTRVSNASSSAKHSEHLHLLSTKTTRKRINTSKISFDNQRRRS